MTKDEFNKLYDSLREPINKENMKKFNEFRTKEFKNAKSSKDRLTASIKMLIDLQNEKLNLKSRGLRKLLCGLFTSSDRH